MESQSGGDLVLAAAQDYDWEDVRLFVESLRATGFSGEIRFFAAGLSQNAIRELEAARVDVSRPRRFRPKIGGYRFEPYGDPTTPASWHLQGVYWRLIRTVARFSRDRQAAINRYTAAVANVDVARYFWYLDYLSKSSVTYRNVMLTDVRDVVFLANPFDFTVGDTACFFLEDELLHINQEVFNAKWMVYAYGPGALVELGDKPISCSGVTIGDASAVREYLAVMVEHLARLTRQDQGIDQGVHNYVLHKGLVRNARLISNGDGPVLTVGIMSANRASKALEERASMISVVHQYNRHPDLAASLQRRLRS